MKWISVEDKLPDIDREVLVSSTIMESCGINVAVFKGEFDFIINPPPFDNEVSLFPLFINKRSGYYRNYNYWMPLPEPPKE